jgi:SAM-dependent methyltransferase
MLRASHLVNIFVWLRRRLVASRQACVPSRYPAAAVSSYYQHVHQTNDAYKTNNWLISEIDAILSIAPKSLLEVGCGNGRFLAEIRDRVEQATGVDWARSPILDELGLSRHFALRDITRDELPKADIVCSADVLEHIAPDLLPATLQHLHDAGHEQYHVIACYDDEHSHLSIMEPDAWLQTFRAISDRYRIVDLRQRRDDPNQTICVIATFQPKLNARPHSVQEGAAGQL